MPHRPRDIEPPPMIDVGYNRRHHLVLILDLLERPHPQSAGTTNRSVGTKSLEGPKKIKKKGDVIWHSNEVC